MADPYASTLIKPEANMDPNFTHYRFYNIDSGDALYSYSLPKSSSDSHAGLIGEKIKQLAKEFKLPADTIGWIEIQNEHQLFKRIAPSRTAGIAIPALPANEQRPTSGG